MKGLNIRHEVPHPQKADDGEFIVEYKMKNTLINNHPGLDGGMYTGYTQGTDDFQPRQSVQNISYKKEPDVLRKSNFILRSSISKKDFDRMK